MPFHTLERLARYGIRRARVSVPYGNNRRTASTLTTTAPKRTATPHTRNRGAFCIANI